ncbi:ribokinase [Frigidibacter oleivorans]|uniref:ribokinase n=1 Tax=Frigidibacter oleivorans TaxID=2487129 RepID=UPI000F8CCE4A|nr:ribokinase [Frigidibacter oleivorans]
MTIYNLGSINIDHVYRLPHLPGPGETLAALDYRTGLGGKGANQSAAAARAGARVVHLGAVGPDGGWTLDRLRGWGVEVDHVARVEAATGHAIINVDAAGENSIVIHHGANHGFAFDAVDRALAGAAPGDLLLLQNETAHQARAAMLAAGRGLRVMYSAAPFEVAAVQAVLPHVTLLALNAVEAAQLSAALGCAPEAVPVPQLLITRGAAGADWIEPARGLHLHVASPKVAAVDTTGAGDTFAGYLAAGLDAGDPPEAALRRAAAAAALKVTRHGTADAIPARAEVEAFLAGAGA